jgi:hypothetical protein
MYRKLLYNDDCIYDEVKNIVVYDCDIDWSNYVKWKKKNVDSEKRITIERDAKKKWNQGAPQSTKITNSDDGEVLSFYHTNGNLLKEVFQTQDKQPYLIRTYFAEESKSLLATETIYTKLGDWQMDEGKLKLFPASVQEETRYYHEPYILSYTKKSYEKIKHIVECEYSIYGFLSTKTITRGNLQLKVKYNQNHSLIKKELYKNNILIHLTKYFDNTKTKHYTKEYRETNIEYKEYYINSSLRAEGTLSVDELPLDTWVYYHITNEVEGVHLFNNGKLVNSRINMEDGSFIKEVSYD